MAWFFKARKIRLSRARTKVEEYLTNEKTIYLPSIADDIQFAAVRMKGYADYNDLVILSVARRLGLPLLTFDEELKKLARASHVRVIEVKPPPGPR